MNHSLILSGLIASLFVLSLVTVFQIEEIKNQMMIDEKVSIMNSHRISLLENKVSSKIPINKTSTNKTTTSTTFESYPNQIAKLESFVNCDVDPDGCKSIKSMIEYDHKAVAIVKMCIIINDSMHITQNGCNLKINETTLSDYGKLHIMMEQQ